MVNTAGYADALLRLVGDDSIRFAHVYMIAQRLHWTHGSRGEPTHREIEEAVDLLAELRRV